MKRTLLALVSAAVIVAMGGAVTVDRNLPTYKPVPGVSGNIKSVGSDTMNNLMALWAEGFRKFYPNVQVEIEGKGSSTAPPALISGTSTFGPMSRKMKSAEADSFEERFGYKPTFVRTSIDMLAVFVHKDNPIADRGLTLEELDGIFSKSFKSGHDNVTTWGDLGLTGEWRSKPISLYGRNSASGTYGYFKEHALFKGDYKDTVKEQPGSSAVVQGVGSDKYAIGYSGIGYKTEDVRVVPLAPSGSRAYVEATPDNAGEYPLARFLYLYVNYKPGYELDPLRAEFLRYVFSRAGQEAVIKDGFLPVSARIAAEDLGKVNIRLGR
jgi:phosphate transport system substrate-binding protein